MSLKVVPDSLDIALDPLSFWSEDNGKALACGIDRDVFLDLGDHHGLIGTEDEKFRALRPEIEHLALAKYCAGRIEEDGTLVIRTADLLRFGFRNELDEAAALEAGGRDQVNSQLRNLLTAVSE